MNEKTELDPASIDWTPAVMEQIQNKAGRVLGLMPEVEPYLRAASKLGAEFEWWCNGVWKADHNPFSDSDFALRVSPAWVPPGKPVKRECATCGHKAIRTDRYPCCKCWPQEGYLYWTPLAVGPEPASEPAATGVERLHCTCRYYDLSFTEYPCRECHHYSLWQPKLQPGAVEPEPEKRERVVELTPHVLRDGSVVVDLPGDSSFPLSCAYGNTRLRGYRYGQIIAPEPAYGRISDGVNVVAHKLIVPDAVLWAVEE